MAYVTAACFDTLRLYGQRKGNKSRLYGQRKGNESSADSDVDYVSDNTGKTLHFNPLTSEVVQFLCKRLNVQHKAQSTLCTAVGELGAPCAIVKIKGDGNCFFRAVSVAVCGTEEHHETIRNAVVMQLESNEAKYRSILRAGYHSVSAYIHTSKMNSLGSWVTEVEIQAAADCLGVNIYTYYTERWLEYSCGEGLLKSTQGIYLKNGGSHYETVVCAKRPQMQSCYGYCKVDTIQTLFTASADDLSEAESERKTTAGDSYRMSEKNQRHRHEHDLADIHLEDWKDDEYVPSASLVYIGNDTFHNMDYSEQINASEKDIIPQTLFSASHLAKDRSVPESIDDIFALRPTSAGASSWTCDDDHVFWQENKIKDIYLEARNNNGKNNSGSSLVDKKNNVVQNVDYRKQVNASDHDIRSRTLFTASGKDLSPLQAKTPGDSCWMRSEWDHRHWQEHEIPDINSEDLNDSVEYDSSTSLTDEEPETLNNMDYDQAARDEHNSRASLVDGEDSAVRDTVRKAVRAEDNAREKRQRLSEKLSFFVLNTSWQSFLDWLAGRWWGSVSGEQIMSFMDTPVIPFGDIVVAAHFGNRPGGLCSVAVKIKDMVLTFDVVLRRGFYMCTELIRGEFEKPIDIIKELICILEEGHLLPRPSTILHNTDYFSVAHIVNEMHCMVELLKGAWWGVMYGNSPIYPAHPEVIQYLTSQATTQCANPAAAVYYGDEESSGYLFEIVTAAKGKRFKVSFDNKGFSIGTTARFTKICDVLHNIVTVEHATFVTRPCSQLLAKLRGTNWPMPRMMMM